ncbi:MAG: hemolysin-type calcium-binding repeat family protein [Thermoleophilia bacterium]|nr:hemolysin-type calcium-binding repeat family protein [Thermoleophilia bacterium]
MAHAVVWEYPSVGVESFSWSRTGPCSWDEASARVTYRSPTVVSLDAHPRDGSLMGCAAAGSVPAGAVREVDVEVGPTSATVWIRPGGGDVAPGRVWNVRAASAHPGRVALVLAYDRGVPGRRANVTATAAGLDVNSDGIVDVRVEGLPTWNVHVLSQGTSGRWDLRSVPASRTVPAWFELGDGDDVLLAPSSGPRVDARTGDGNDVVVTTTGRDTIRTYAGDDRVQSGDNADQVMAGGGDDVVDAGRGSDAVFADSDAAAVSRRHSGDDVVRGGAGADQLDLGAGRDRGIGGSGGDVLLDEAGTGSIDGGPGNDSITVHRQSATMLVLCGAGNDLVRGVAVSRGRACERQSRARFGGLRRDSDPPGWHEAQGTVDPRRYDWAPPMLDAFTGTGRVQCAWDAASGAVAYAASGVGDSIQLVDIDFETAYTREGLLECDDVPVHRSNVRAIDVSVGSPRSNVTVYPWRDAATPDEVKTRIYAPASAGRGGLQIKVDDEYAPVGVRTRIVASATGLDLNGDGDDDVTVVGTDRWNVQLDVTNRGGTFDLRRVPARPNEETWYRMSTGGNVLDGPDTGPDVYMVTLSGMKSRGNDVIRLAGGDDQLDAQGGDDDIRTGGGNDIVLAGIGDDRVDVGAGDDWVIGDDWRIKQPWADGNDRVLLGPGTDNAYLAGGSDTAYGGTGRDLISDEEGPVVFIDAGPGDDWVSVRHQTRRANVHCGAGRDEREVNTDPGRERFTSCERQIRWPWDGTLGRPYLPGANGIGAMSANERIWN